jgi:hypothetical protein
VVDVVTKVALSADVTGLATAVAGLHEGFEGLRTSIGMPGGSAHSGAHRKGISKDFVTIAFSYSEAYFTKNY